MADPGWLDADDAAAHLSLRLAPFLRRVKAGDLPRPSYHLGPRSPRWNRAALDAALAGSTALPSDPGSEIAAEILREGREKRAKQIRQGSEKGAGGWKRPRIPLSAASAGRNAA